MTKLSEEDYKKNREITSKHKKRIKLYNLVKTILVTLNVLAIIFLASMTSIGMEEVYDLYEDSFVLSITRTITYLALIYASYQLWKQTDLSHRLRNIIIYNKNRELTGETKYTKKIIHYEDEKMLLDMYGIKLRNAGLEVKGFIHPPSTAKKLIRQVLYENPNLIIMSVIMPIMDGFKAAEILKKDDRTKNYPIMFLTNNAGDDLRERAKKLGAIDYIIKANYIPSEVVEKIKGFLDNY